MPSPNYGGTELPVTISCVLLVPVELAAAANQMAIDLGYATNHDTYTKPVLKDGALAYYGAHTFASGTFVMMLENAIQGIIPPDLVAKGYSAEQVQALVGAMLYSNRNFGEPIDNWNDLLEAKGLTEPVYEGEI